MIEQSLGREVAAKENIRPENNNFLSTFIDRKAFTQFCAAQKGRDIPAIEDSLTNPIFYELDSLRNISLNINRHLSDFFGADFCERHPEQAKQFEEAVNAGTAFREAMDLLKTAFTDSEKYKAFGMIRDTFQSLADRIEALLPPSVVQNYIESNLNYHNSIMQIADIPPSYKAGNQDSVSRLTAAQKRFQDHHPA